MHTFEVHSDESACIKSGSLGMDQVYYPTMGKVPVQTTTNGS